jgi:mannose-1-phosphate guanylyltransferase
MKTVILCGGSGTRLWPLSRTLYPKQFYPLFEGHSLYQRTITRNVGHSDGFVVVVNHEQYFMAQDQFQELKLAVPVTYILEPEGRNTAPAIALAALACDPAETLLVVPSDHLIHDVSAFKTAVVRAAKLANTGALVTFGIKPEHAETGFGYIEANGEDVASFREKPDAATAAGYVASGRHYWNSGMFCFTAGSYLSELAAHAPAIHVASAAAFEEARGRVPLKIDANLMRAIPSDSIDYAVMERAATPKVVPVDMGWSDLGSFDALYGSLPKDNEGNTLTPFAHHVNARRNLVVTQKRLVALVDVEDLVVVDTPDALLITKRGSSQKVKDVVAHLKTTQPELTHVHVTAHRPWGSYTVLEDSSVFKVKRIVVKPGARLSLQKHKHRSEHWVVVDGRAWVTVGEKSFSLERNESTYIPIGEVHRLENKEDRELVLIEAQVGSYLGEDDIVRLVDDYQRP